MKYIKTYEDYLNEYSFLYKVNEKKGDTYSYGCVMLYFDFPSIKGIQESIKQEDLYTETEDRSYGFEDEPHVTLLYGLHEEVSEKDIFDRLKVYKIDDLLLTNISAFENNKYDVLKFDVEDGVSGANYLHKMNKALTELPHTTDFPNYHPHSTIAYLKPGKAKEYIQQLKGTQHIVKPVSLVYSMPSGEKVNIKVNNFNYLSYKD